MTVYPMRRASSKDGSKVLLGGRRREESVLTKISAWARKEKNNEDVPTLVQAGEVHLIVRLSLAEGSGRELLTVTAACKE